MKPVEIGIFAPGMKPVQSLGSGEVGYIATGFKTVHECRVGDTITRASAPAFGASARIQYSQANGLCWNLSR